MAKFAYNRLMAFMAAAAFALISGAAFAHHGDAGRYESTFTTVTGTVVEFNFVNPHATIVLDVKDDSGNVERWVAEMGSPGMLAKHGLSPKTVKTGDTLTVTGRRRKNGEPFMTVSGGGHIKAADGNELYQES
jgi:DNA/RNA endonuclease YhcR with UshA esterase domain